MKKESFFKHAFIASAFLSIQVLFAQTTHTIILKCDTSEINETNVNEVCNFGQDRAVSNKEYTKNVEVGDIIVWRGMAINQGLNSSLELTEVEHESGKKFFGKETIKDNDGLIMGEVVQGQPGDEEKYNIKFKVYIDGRRLSGRFEIDPKIRVYR